MELHEIEYAAQIVFDMCKNHPEICPHHWQLIEKELSKDKITYRYRCHICDSTTSKVEEIKEE